MPPSPPLPISTKALRFAPARGARQAAYFWKLWARGNDIFACLRAAGGDHHLSVHESGAVHYRLERKHKRDLAPILTLDTGPWRHAFELRFLLSDGAKLPAVDTDLQRSNKAAILLPIPDNHFLCVNLILGEPGTALTVGLPTMFDKSGQRLWQTILPNGCPAVLVGRLLLMDEKNINQVKEFREQLKPGITLTQPPTGREYLELLGVWSSELGGNIVIVVPMGDESVRVVTEAHNSKPTGQPSVERELAIAHEPSAVEICAPDGAVVATVHLEEANQFTKLSKCRRETREITTGRLSLRTQNLVPGSAFFTAPSSITCRLSINGFGTQDIAIPIYCRFDGAVFTAEIRQVSTSMTELESSNEVMELAVPIEPLFMSATLLGPACSAKLSAGLLFRDKV